ncbi:GcrA cell cycle regulator [Humitalea rosea]|uniref:GcrA cell cycle regulator n=1 Tax=Humitalea rosea TaxID=990373 RepID=A0A2W7INS2_9PROT|nr:GcrA family cell cycle regulator [Humitalea rosea]PZW47018.1 GcrA cell cycle regulator [Humitalea rosea]
MDWSAEAIETLKALWAEGHSTAEIGRRMGVSKNAIVGKAHRLALPARPSPIRRDGVSQPITSGRALFTPPAQPAPQARPAASEPVAPRAMAAPRPAAAPARAPVAVAPQPSSLRAFPRVSSRTCCWPIGEPGTSGFHFCDGGALTGKPYCAEHAAVAYVRARDRREDAA